MTARSPMLEIQGAVYRRLTDDQELTGLAPGGVFDYLPETAPYPFTVIGEATETPDNAHDRHGWQTVPVLHVWTRSRGFAQALRIGARVAELLDHQPLDVPGYHHVATLFEFSQTLQDPEPPGDIRHLILRFRVLTEQIP
ncbi:DUF3168 domain-containing protein [Streptomyces sp. NPDC006798]|uniref:DUF3168 domain-containing protein n=1 Tax=Streptomyces sp. NPDC006798 TaxID=3155462 RepID=UPI0033E0D4C4